MTLLAVRKGKAAHDVSEGISLTGSPWGRLDQAAPALRFPDMSSPRARSLTRWLPRWCAEAVAVPLAAQVATQPVVTAITAQFSVVGVLANAQAGPCVGPATVLGFAAAAASVVSARLAAVFGFGAGWAAQPIIWIARYGAGCRVRWPIFRWVRR